MTQSDIGIVEKLRRTERGRNEKWQCVADPTILTEAAAIITEMVEALENARNQLQHVNKCHVHLDSTDSLLGEIDTLLAKVRSK